MHVVVSHQPLEDEDGATCTDIGVQVERGCLGWLECVDNVGEGEFQVGAMGITG